MCRSITHLSAGSVRQRQVSVTPVCPLSAVTDYKSPSQTGSGNKSDSELEVMASKFVSDEAFSVALERHREEKETAINWSELEQNVVHKVTAIDKRVSVYGVCYILHLLKRNGEEYTVFAPRSLIEEFRRNRKPSYSPYLISLGVDHFQVTRHKKHKFELVFVHEEGAKEVELDDEPPN